ncbi:helix-turn-helix domain-containing protein [Umezawaea sp. Da 62-37]|uniref:TetR/AcrR family transcriptional regulator n=1 Tax=Umezawaea sp. Da 62-37 TaxID=3075927 RepID=UPI0028F6E17D|nr:helix-turn-helix domain-containing protein [Umezawaea sp. Da 62-37]WNV86849.1 helix-turn-helix domain-containing protein [Umezawaea sp. Da 62-37]
MRRIEGRPLRADARRNRDKILSTAVVMFARDGLDATLDGIAKEAGVGPATLYRNFPTREALIEAAYRSELHKLCEASDELLAALPPKEALRAWMGRFLDYVGAKIGMADALRALIATGVNPYDQTRDLMHAALASLLDAGAADGSLRSDVAAADVAAGMTGIAIASGNPPQRDLAERLLDLLMDGLVTTR